MSVSAFWVQSGLNWRMPGRGFTANTRCFKWRSRVYQMAAGNEDGTNGDFLWIDPAPGLAGGKGNEDAEDGLKELEAALPRSNDAFMRREKRQLKTLPTASRKKWRSTVISGRAAFIHSSFTSNSDCLRASLRFGN